MNWSTDNTGELHKSENRISNGWDVERVEWENGSLWDLLHEQALQASILETFDAKLLELIICWRLGKAGCPSLRCQHEEEVFAVEKAKMGEVLFGHS